MLSMCKITDCLRITEGIASKMEDIFFSIIMPTYNSEKTIGKALASIRNQKFDQKMLEILVIDGGSEDNTLDIAAQYGATILFNEERVPEAAKQLGFRNAKGKWVIKQDSDEVYINNMQLARKKEFIDHNPNIYCLLSDRLLPGKRCGISCAYVNYCGDPFSYIVYRLRGSIVRENKKYFRQKDTYGNIYQYKKGDSYPIGDGGCTALNIEKFREMFGEKYDSQEYVNLSTQKLLEKTGFMGCIPGDNIYHYSKSDFFSYLRKVRFKIHFNLNGTNALGYAAKAESNNRYSRRKWLFVLYAMSVVLPIIDSVRMAVSQHDPTFLLHFVYTYYVLVITGVEVVLKIWKKDGGNYSYG